MDENKAHVYVRTDFTGCIVQIEGESTLENLSQFGGVNGENIHLIEEGEPCPKLTHAQFNYPLRPLLDDFGIHRWKLVEDGDSPYGVRPVLRSEEELEADRAAIPAPAPTETERLRADVDFLLVMQGVE